VRRTAAWLLGALSLAAAGVGLASFAAASGHAARTPSVANGRRLFVSGCASCHGLDARGITGRGPNLRGVGELAADFYLRTGRMPLSQPTDYPARSRPAYDEPDIEDLIAYVGSFGGPAIPPVHASTGSLSRGKELFTMNCAGCHQVVARGGIVTGAIAPPLQQASATQVAEAMRIGPYLMPVFGPKSVPPADVDSIARYVLYTRNLDNRGGWGIGNIGPIPEGMVAWLIAILGQIGVARLAGERAAR
jgi:ubiquinol-cytochrome c reductase cytochrome c subunit